MSIPLFVSERPKPEMTTQPLSSSAASTSGFGLLQARLAFIVLGLHPGNIARGIAETLQAGLEDG